MALDPNNILDLWQPPGILLLSRDLCILYIDNYARGLCNRLANRQKRGAQGVLPVEILELHSAALSDYQSAEGEHQELERLFTDIDPAITVRAVRVQLSDDYMEVLIVLRELRAIDRIVEYAAKNFGLTLKEQRIARDLFNGWTNKEIANNLHVTEQTIKEHLKHIMKKTGASTRTGLIVRMVNADGTDSAPS